MSIALLTKTEETVTLTTGDSVLVLRLNDLHKESAARKAHRLALADSLPLTKGGKEYSAVQTEVKQMPKEKQAAYLVQQEYPRIVKDAEAAFPLPDKPEQGETAPEQFALLSQEWEQKTQDIHSLRQEQIERVYKEKTAAFLALTIEQRQQLCEAAYFAENYSLEFGKAYVMELLYRAVRHQNAPHLRYFSCPSAVEDADDADRNALWECYLSKDDPAIILSLPTEAEAA